MVLEGCEAARVALTWWWWRAEKWSCGLTMSTRVSSLSHHVVVKGREAARWFDQVDQGLLRSHLVVVEGPVV